MPLGPLGAGSYSINMTIVSGDISFDLITYDGQHVATTTKSDRMISFDLPAADDTVGLIGDTTDNEVDVRYDVQRIGTTTSAGRTTRATSDGVHRVWEIEVGSLWIIGQWLFLSLMSGSVLQ